MKVLFLGEFSGLYKYIVEGLIEKKVDVEWYANGDYWKKINGMTGTLEANTGIKLYDKILYPMLQMHKWKNFDVVHIISPIVFSPKINVLLLKWIKKKNKKLILTSAGTDVEVYRHYKAGKFKLPYYAFDECDYLDELYADEKLYAKISDKIIKMVDYIIPVCYEYSEVYRNHPKYLVTIPMAINVDSIEYIDNIVNEKIVFIHGINRDIIKGTPYIREAMNNIQDKYPSETEMIINPRMPFDEYLKVLKRTNIVLDQCKGYVPGMNALISMAMGRVVLGDNEEIAREDGSDILLPAINIRPDVKNIEAAIEWVINNREKIRDIGHESRKYVEQVHDYRKIAQKYIEIWNRVLQ